MYTDHNESLKGKFKRHERLQNAAVSFILKEMATGSGIVLLCGCGGGGAQAREECQWQASQTHVANLAALFPYLFTSQSRFRDLNLSKATLEQN